MPLHPISVVDHVLEECRSYLRTEFRARDPKLRAALEAAINTPLLLARELFFQAHRAFAASKAWSELGLDPQLARATEEGTMGWTEIEVGSADLRDGGSAMLRRMVQ